MTSPEYVIPEFKMSAFVAATGLRRYLRDHPGTPVDQAAASLRRSDADYSAADFVGGVRLHDQLPNEISFENPRDGIRAGLAVLIETHLPWWCRFFPYGRQRLAVALTQDELQTFKSAGLFEENPPADVVEWWDRFAAKMRGLKDERLNAQGRSAELLSMNYERHRLLALGITDQPRWIAIEDNGAGYDVQSYDLTEYGLKNRLIEVKSSTRNPPRMILSRGEWNAANEYGEAYFVHLWKLPSEELLVLSAAEIASHIPADCGNGRWTEIEIQF